MRKVTDLPGPRGLPFFGNALRLDPTKLHALLERLYRTHGPLFRFRIGRQVFVVVTDPELTLQALRRRPEAFRRTARLQPIFHELGVDGIFSAEGEAWRRQRRLMNPAFKLGRLLGVADTILRVTGRLHQRFEREARAGSMLDIQREFMRYTVDITTEIAFGYEMNTVEQGPNAFQSDLEEIFPAMNRRLNAPFPTWRYLKLPRDRRLDAAMERVRAVVRDIIARSRARLDAEPERRENPVTILDALLVAHEGDEQGESLTEEELVANVFTLLLAGEDTTANTLAWMVHVMAENAEVEQRLHAEAAAILGEHRVLDDLRRSAELTYTEAVAMETLRTRSPAPFLFVQPNEKTVLGDVEIDTDVAVALLTRQIAMLPELFSDPERFLPERWLKNGSAVAAVDHGEWAHEARCMLAFGGGPRICPGRSLALLETQTAISMLARSFAVQAVPGAQPVGERFDFTMSPTNLQVRLLPR